MTTENIEKLFALRDGKRRRNPSRKFQNYTSSEGNSCLYAIGSEAHRFVKIGRSRIPYNRMSDLQTASPVELMMLSFIEADAQGVVQMETMLHQHMKMAGLKGQGEWWNCDTRIITPLFSAAAALSGAKVVHRVGDTSSGFVDDHSAHQRTDSFLFRPSPNRKVVRS